MPLIILLWLTGAGQSETIRCEYVARQFCGLDHPCEKIEIKDMYLLVPLRAVLKRADPWRSDRMLWGPDASQPATVQRCDQKGCTAVDVWAFESGAYMNVWEVRGGYLLKLFIGPEGPLMPSRNVGEFLEVATQFLGAYVSTGRCAGWVAR